MAPRINPTAQKQVGRVLLWLFPSRLAVVATGAVEIAAFLPGLPLLAHVAVGLTVHVMAHRLCAHRSSFMS